jgi:hypothetical protein
LKILIFVGVKVGQIRRYSFVYWDETRNTLLNLVDSLCLVCFVFAYLLHLSCDRIKFSELKIIFIWLILLNHKLSMTCERVRVNEAPLWRHFIEEFKKFLSHRNKKQKSSLFRIDAKFEVHRTEAFPSSSIIFNQN